jgi:hypothetical protein
MSKFQNPYFVTQKHHDAVYEKWMEGCTNTYTRKYEWEDGNTAWEKPNSQPWIDLKHVYMLLQTMQILHEASQTFPTTSTQNLAKIENLKEQIKLDAPSCFLRCYSIVKQQDVQRWAQIVWNYECYSDAVIMTSINLPSALGYENQDHRIEIHWSMLGPWSASFSNFIDVDYKGPFELDKVPENPLPDSA